MLTDSVPPTRQPSLRVLAVTNMYPTAADPVYGIFVASQIASLERAGATVQVEVINGRRSKLEYVGGIPRVRRLIQNGRFDVVHAHYGLTGFVASFHDLPLVVSFCGDDLNGTSNGRGGTTLRSRLARRLSYFAARRADAIICKSERLRLALPRRIDRERAHVIHNGVDVAAFHPGDRSDARRRLGLPADANIVLFPHSLRQRAVKRFDVAEAAIQILNTHGFAARLWVINGIPQDKMPDYYRAADCLLLTSDTEGSPNVVKEAICCNRPVVSVDVGDVRRWMDLAPGCLVVSRVPDEIAMAIAQVLRSHPSVDGTVVRDQLNLNGVAQGILGVYEEARHVREEKSELLSAR